MRPMLEREVKVLEVDEKRLLNALSSQNTDFIGEGVVTVHFFDTNSTTQLQVFDAVKDTAPTIAATARLIQASGSVKNGNSHLRLTIHDEGATFTLKTPSSANTVFKTQEETNVSLTKHQANTLYTQNLAFFYPKIYLTLSLS